MRKQIHLLLGDNEVGQILDGLEVRAEAWRKTAAYLRTGDSGDNFFIIEECSNAEEAAAIANDYASIIDKLNAQVERQRKLHSSTDRAKRPTEGTTTAFAIYINTLLQGSIPVERDGENMPIACASARAAQCEIAEHNRSPPPVPCWRKRFRRRDHSRRIRRANRPSPRRLHYRRTRQHIS